MLCRYLNKALADSTFIISMAGKLAEQYLSEITTLPNFIIAFFISIWVMSLREHHSKLINALAKPTFAVYIVHQVPAFISFIWARIFFADRWKENHHFWYLFVVFVAIYTVCILTEYIRRDLIENKIVNLKLFDSISDSINGIIKKAGFG